MTTHCIQYSKGKAYISPGVFFPDQTPPEILQWFENECIYPNNIYYIHNLYVEPDHRRKGICNQIMKIICDQFQNSYLCLHIRRKHDEEVPAFSRCYKRYGFTQIKNLTTKENNKTSIDFFIRFPG